MSVEAFIALGVFSMVIILAALFQLSGGTAEDTTHETLKRMARPSLEGGDESAIMRETRRKKAHLLDVVLSRFNVLQKLEESMWQAGLYMRVSEVLLIMLLLLGAGAAAGMAWSGDLLIASGVGFGLSLIPIFYIRFRQKRRVRAFGMQLPEVLDLLKSSLEAGHTLLRGLQVVVEEFPDPASSEIRMVLEQARLGVPLPRALEDMLKRVPEESLRFLLVAIKVQADAGTSLAEIIGRLAETIRTRHRVQLQIRALTAQGRLSGIIVGILPVIVLGAFSLIQPSYAHTLFTDPLGIKLVKTAIFLDIMAFITIRRLLKLDY